MKIKNLIEKDNLKLNSQIKYNEPMNIHTSFKIGGPAECYIKIENETDLKKIVQFAKTKNIQINIIGNGSNLLVLDDGIKGITVKNEIQKFEIIKEKENKIKIIVGAGNKLTEISHKLAKESITGFEEISGIPGTIGGAIRMNAGANGKEIEELVKKVKCIDYEGNIKEFTKQECEFKYRNSIFESNKYIIIEIELEVKNGIKEEIEKSMQNLLESRKKKQPLEYPNAGSTFKRGNGYITAQLIDEAGLKGYKIGGATVSTKHAGFIINEKDATAQDVIKLIKYVKEKVYEKFNKNIELEIEIIGNNKE